MANPKKRTKKYSGAGSKIAQDEMNRRSAEAQGHVDEACRKLFEENGLDMDKYQTDLMKDGWRLVMEYMPMGEGVILNLCKIQKSHVVVFKKYA